MNNPRPTADSHDLIHVRGARENNLQNVSLDIPKRRLTVFTGVSGSGKSSLVFGTIAAESQRLINETYSAFLQSFMPSLGRPDVDATGRLRGEQHAPCRRHLPGHDQLLDVAAGQVARRGVEAGGPHGELAHEAFGVLADRSPAEHAATGERSPPVVEEHEVLPHGERRDCTVAHALLRDVGQSARPHVPR